MGLESVRIIRAENIPIETRLKHSLPDKGFIEVKAERTSPVSFNYEKYTGKKIRAIAQKLMKKGIKF